MKTQKILNISNVDYDGYVFNLELESKSEEDDLYWIEQDSGIVSHNCLPKDLAGFMRWGRERGHKMEMFEAAEKVNLRVRLDKDWEKIKGATSENNYGEDD